MKGIVFAEFLEMVENRFSPEVADHIIQASDLPSGGAYTSLGTYEHAEMTCLVSHLSRNTGIPAQALVHTFGMELFKRFSVLYPEFFADVHEPFTLLERLEGTIHLEVIKLYPDAEVPKFDCHRPDPATLKMLYKSPRGMADLAQGLIEGCGEYFGEQLEIEREDLSGGQNTMVQFTIRRQAKA